MLSFAVLSGLISGSGYATSTKTSAIFIDVSKDGETRIRFDVAQEILRKAAGHPTVEQIMADRSNCPLREFIIEGARVSFGLMDDETFQSDEHLSDFYKSSTRELVVKILRRATMATDRNRAVVDLFAMDKAVLEVLALHRVKGIPVVYQASNTVGGPSEICKFRMSIMSNGGCGNLIIPPRGPTSEGTAAFIAAETIKTLRRIHRYGIIHGSVGATNILLDDVSNPSQVTLVDFSYSEPFVTPEGDHIPETAERRTVFGLYEVTMSFHEFNLQPVSRRVDMLRLAETMLIALDMTSVERQLLQVPDGAASDSEEIQFKEGADLLEAKRNLHIAGGEERQIFNDFYRAMIQMTFEAVPDYDEWIRRFLIAAGRGNDEDAVLDDDPSLPESIATGAVHGQGQVLHLSDPEEEETARGRSRSTVVADEAVRSKQRGITRFKSFPARPPPLDTTTPSGPQSGIPMRINSVTSELNVEDFSGMIAESAGRILAALSSDPFRLDLKKLRGACPPTTISLDNGGALVQIPTGSRPAKEGTGSSIYFATGTCSSGPISLAIKVLEVNTLFTYEGLRRERAILPELDGLNGGVVRMYSVDSVPGLLPGCRAVTMVTDFGGSIRLGVLPTKVLLARAAARSIEILKEIHDRGIVHGDIHSGNIVIENPDDIESTTKIIDFGRSSLFIVKSASGWIHRPRRRIERDSRFSPPLLSIFELREYPASRRDDMYRLAETLVFAISEDKFKAIYTQRRDPTKVLELKENLEIPEHEVVNAFLQDMKQLGYKQRPNYEFWISVFRDHTDPVSL